MVSHYLLKNKKMMKYRMWLIAICIVQWLLAVRFSERKWDLKNGWMAEVKGGR